MRAESIPRETFLDATRGVAMVCVMVAHFGWIYFTRHPGTPFLVLSSWMMFAAPAFMLVSGILLGFIHATRPHGFAAFRIKLVDRGLFLLTAGHLIIGLAYLNYAEGWRGALRSGQILDAVGVAILIGPAAVTRTRPATRGILALGLFCASWAWLAMPMPAGYALRIVKDTLVGGGGWWLYNFPILPWVSLYLAGTALGSTLAPRLVAGDTAGARRIILRTAVVSLLLALTLSVVAGRMRTTEWSRSSPGQLLERLGSISSKLPPSPAFFLFWGGLALLLILAVLVWQRSGRAGRVLAMAEVIGRNSLFIFLVQEHLFVLLLWTWNPPYGWYWPLLMVALMAVGILMTLWWDRHRYGRFLTVGYGRWWGPDPVRVSAQPGT